MLIGTAGADVLHAGANILVGGQGADTFVFDQPHQAGVLLTHIADYSAAQGDAIDVSALVAAQPAAAPAAFRVAEDASGAFATLQQQTFDAKGAAHWTDVAQLDGLHLGDDVALATDAAHPATLAHLHVIAHATA